MTTARLPGGRPARPSVRPGTILADTEPVHVYVGGRRGDSFALGTGTSTTAGEARALVVAAIDTQSPSEVTVRALGDPCLAYRWLPAHAFLGIEAGWRVQHMAGYCLPTCTRGRQRVAA